MTRTDTPTDRPSDTETRTESPRLVVRSAVRAGIAAMGNHGNLVGDDADGAMGNSGNERLTLGG